MKTLFLLLSLTIAVVLIGCGSSKDLTKNSGNQMITTPSGLKFVDLLEGTGETVKHGQKVSVHYIGTLENGTKFDASYDRGKPFTFTLGKGEVIKGWDEGLAGMKIGGKRKLVIPPELGYGSRDLGKIPANSTLIFEVELIKID